MKILIRGIVLLITLTVAFLVTTIFFDTLERHMGYYDQGLKDSASVSYSLYMRGY